MPTVPAARSPRTAYLLCFVLLGISLSMVGPAMTHLRARAGIGIGAGGIILAGQGIGYVVASLLAGRRIDHHGAGHGLLLRATGAAVLASALLQVARPLWAVTVLFAVIGGGGGAMDVTCNTLLVWNEPPGRIGSALNGLHLRFGIGAIVAPLVVAASLQLLQDLWLVTVVLAAGWVGIAWLLHGHATPVKPVRGQHPEHDRPHHTAPALLLVLAAGFFALYVGAEGTFGAWSTTYGESLDLGWSSAPAVLTAVYWAGFTLGRVAAVAVTKRRPVDPVLTVSCGAATVAAVALALADGHPAPTWVMVALLGFTLGPQYATMLAVVDRRAGLDGRSTSRLVGAAGAGGLVVPLATGAILDHVGVGTLPAVVAVTIGGAWLLAVAVVARHPMAPEA